ncbi:Transmembrane protein [Toxocara canis]|uniref:Transmembrane protein n=1 Tax=Toxocara canis TaxID=6265 RepID=A0A0B2V4R7_TOXCA|nr:Transmembrane protein [Toxocara canis]
MQIPLRAAIRDLEEAARLGASIEIDTGIARRRRKTSMSSKLGERLLTEFVISDAAKRFIVQRELLRANSGKALCVPIFLWLGTFGVSFVFLNIATHLLGPIAAFSLSTVTAFTAFYTFHRRFIAFLEQKLDITTCKKSDVYIDGARDFLKSTMTLNRLLRSTMGADGEKCIAENGDRIGDQLPYSKRLRIVEQLNRERNFDIKRDLENYDA